MENKQLNNGLSDEQNKVINSPIEKDVLVNAGAGSGKTFVLKQKIAKHLANKDILTSQLLVLTFTNNAAHEMKVKIIDEVSKLKSDKLSSQEISTIKDAINSAHIQTFDSFAAEIVKTYADKLNIPSNFTVADEYVLDAKVRELIEVLFRNKYDNNDQAFINFISKYNIRDDAKTQKALLDLYYELEKLSPLEKKQVISKIEANFNDESFFKECWDKYRDAWIEQETRKIKKGDAKDKDAAIAKLQTKVEVDRGQYNEEFKKYSAQKQDALYLLQLYYELQKMVDEYKNKSNAFTFADIANKALFLLQNFPDVASEVRNKYKYIMVDEYQDTNDIQEKVIEILLAPKENGERNHLFTVGDAKQSIYAFRNADINIFLNRDERYKQCNNDKEEVIPMFYNFRSFKEVIDNINTIFVKYMTKDHGAINYSDSSQMLQLAKNHSHWSKEGYLATNNKMPAEFGLHIITTDEPSDFTDYNANAARLWECKAIIQDIKNKVHSKFQVWDVKDNKFRNCNYGDFYILVRTKGNYKIYEEQFKNAGIILNNQIQTNLVEINPIMLINSFISYFALLETNDTSKKAFEKKKHIYASIMRSYVFKDSVGIFGDAQTVYNDQHILDSIENESFINDPMFKALNAFYDRNKDKPFSKMFINLVSEFGINGFLYKVGEVEKNAAKIESLYKLIQSIETSGGGIKSFIDLLDIISKHRIELGDTSVTDLNNCVTLMTIHQSKGLERQIVYLPNSVNHLGGKTNFEGIEYDFNKHFGILLPDYNMEDYRTNKDNAKIYPNGSCIYTIPYKLFKLVNKNDANEINEHVRLFYVALTRAVQAVYIVGFPKCEKANNGYVIKENNRETLFNMLSYVWGNDLFPYDSAKAFPINNWHKMSLEKEDPIEKTPLEVPNLNDSQIEFKPWGKKRASQLPTIVDEDIDDQIISKGNDLHSILEKIDFNNPNLDFINEPNYKEIISKVVNMDLFTKDLKGATFRSEYEYFDPTFQDWGYIDLLAIKDGTYYIIDYKLFNIDKAAYERQMHIYQRNVERIFNIKDKSKIKLILLSLEKQETKLVDVK